MPADSIRGLCSGVRAVAAAARPALSMTKGRVTCQEERLVQNTPSSMLTGQECSSLGQHMHQPHTPVGEGQRASERLTACGLALHEPFCFCWRRGGGSQGNCPPVVAKVPNEPSLRQNSGSETTCPSVQPVASNPQMGARAIHYTYTCTCSERKHNQSCKPPSLHGWWQTHVSAKRQHVKFVRYPCQLSEGGHLPCNPKTKDASS